MIILINENNLYDFKYSNYKLFYYYVVYDIKIVNKASEVEISES